MCVRDLRATFERARVRRQRKIGELFQIIVGDFKILANVFARIWHFRAKETRDPPKTFGILLMKYSVENVWPP